MKLNYQALDIH